MGGGLMQLVAMGAQDVFLTGNPQITFFKVVYRRHTNFSKECIVQEFNGTGANLTCTLSRNGDLVQEIYLHGKTPTTLTGDVTSQVVKTVEVEIGGQKIDKHYGTWLNIYDELFETNHDYQAAMCAGNATTAPEVFIPLRFWFNRNPGLALPLIALQYHEVKVLVELENSTYLTDANLLVNYVYLDTDERRRFAQVSHEYLIEQVQHTGSESLSTTGGSVTLTYNHPVKALFWRGLASSTDTYKAKLQLNGHDRFTEQTDRYFHLVQPYESGLGHSHSLDKAGKVWSAAGTVGGVDSAGMYSFCLKPGEHQPSGSCNFSRIDNARLVFSGTFASSTTVNIFALNYNVLRIMSGMGGLTYSN